MGEDNDYWTLQAMDGMGGEFIKQLAILYRRADSDNKRKIKEAWPEYWERYSEMGQNLKEREEE